MKNIIIILLFVITLVSVGLASYFYGKSSKLAEKQTSTTAPIENPTSSPVATSSASLKGTVAGRLCYPSSILPKGKIVAKEVNTQEVFSQDYIGSIDGGGTNYTINLPIGTYYLKYDAVNGSNILSGFYTNYSTCVDNPDPANCSGQKTRPLLEVELKEGDVKKNINLCDFYYPLDNPPKF